MHHSSVSWEITLLYFFSWNFIWFRQKKPIKIQNFRLSTAHMKFYQICTLRGSFCWKYVKFQLKSIEDLCCMTRKIDTVFEEKLICCFKNDIRLWRILTWALEILKISTLIGSFCAKYVTFDLKSPDELPYMTLKSDAKFV